tara:strand:+ start:71 stop:388 length:318 start_codon:yes stop_codon:yes gene_type:complete
MSDYHWCHGPTCHTNRTQSRVRGSKGNKVLRTRKIKQDTEWLRQSVFSHFCNQSCLMDFIKLHKDRIVALAPRNEPLETPIEDPVKPSESYYGWRITERGVDTAE